MLGGRLRSQICCERCNYKSDTFDETFTFNLPLPKGNPCTFGDALNQLCSVDLLNKDNKYLCPVCKSKQNATKRFSVNQAPRILIVTIKRFDIFGRKISKRIKYPASFNMKKLMDTSHDKKKTEDQCYDLYGVVTHHGSSTNCGHYVACCKSQSGSWFDCNDSYVSKIGESDALNREAYLLFYQKKIVASEVKVPTTTSV